MYTAPHPVSTALNGMGNDLIDGSGTINPAALASKTPVAVLTSSTPINAPDASPRGLKRSRSPEGYADIPLGGEGDDEDQKPRKRGRPPKSRTSGGVSESPTSTSQQLTQAQLRTPQLQTQGLPQQTNITPTQTSPPKTTPTKSVVKALPTVRDHTTDQLSPEGDEYVPREYDEQGEKKVSPTGHPLEGRDYRCRTFFVPNRGDKLFMLATECARVLNYRDSYLLFNKNRSLFKIIATQPEKDDLIHQEILPYSYRSRQIAIVTAKSMFRQFGSRVISNGRRVRDDYWEAKARKQGFTEDDLAGEKRPGAAKARDAAAAEAASVGAVALGHHPDIIYSNGPGPLDAHGHPQGLQPALGGAMPATLAPLPMIHLAPTEDVRLRDYGNIARPRQEITGAPYQDRTQSSSATEIINQASHTADFNKVLNQQRMPRGKYLDEFWKQPRDVPVSTPQQQQQQQHPSETSPIASQSLQSPPVVSSGMMNPSQQPMLQHQASQMMSPQAYSQPPHPQNPLAQSPIRGAQQPVRPDQMHQRSSGLSYVPGSGAQGSPYGYSQSSQMWGQPPPQPQQSPLSAHHGVPQYSQAAPQQSPHPSQSPHQASQLHHPQSSGSLHSGMAYQSMPGIPQPGYPAMGARGMYQQPSPSPQHYMQQTTAAQQSGMQGWAPPPQQGGQQQHPGPGWPGY
ncbi:hypothetical protein MMC12_000195 [Toensbergia leucococca]|nr:hypothetical protein [Toensbergia leucococca]